jgi:hypothetical protein
MTSLRGVYEPHAAVARVDASFEFTGCSRCVLHNWQHQENKNSKRQTGKARLA